jgi:hypothetical protein
MRYYATGILGVTLPHESEGDTGSCPGLGERQFLDDPLGIANESRGSGALTGRRVRESITPGVMTGFEILKDAVASPQALRWGGCPRRRVR